LKFREYKLLIYSDLYRITGTVKTATLIWYVMWGGSFKYNFWMRTCLYARNNTLLKYSIYPFARFLLHRLKYKLGISIPLDTKIGSGFKIFHNDRTACLSHISPCRNTSLIHFLNWPLQESEGHLEEPDDLLLVAMTSLPMAAVQHTD